MCLKCNVLGPNESGTDAIFGEKPVRELPVMNKKMGHTTVIKYFISQNLNPNSQEPAFAYFLFGWGSFEMGFSACKVNPLTGIFILSLTINLKN